jgi:hypothetical protein
VLITAAGNTTAANNPVNAPGNPTMKYADVKNAVPEIIVPTAVRIATLTMLLRNLFKDRNNPKKTKDVINLSIMFGIKPPGNVVVIPEIKPVTIPKSRTLLKSGKRIIPKNIIANIISGFIPRKIPGITACNTAPIPTKSARATKFFVFISHLSSAILIILFGFSCSALIACSEKLDSIITYYFKRIK